MIVFNEKMLLFYRLFFLILGFAGCPTGSSRAQTSVRDEILATELRRFAAMVTQDTLQLRDMLDDALVYLHSNGLEESKAEHLQAVGSGRIRYRTMTRDQQQVRVRRYGKVAIVNGLVRVDVLVDGVPYLVPLHYAAVYRKRKRQWLLLNWQSTRAQTE